MYWRIYVTYALSGFHKYNFIGNKHKLMELIGCIVSTSIEQCSVHYQTVDAIDTSIEMINNGITKAGAIIINIWKVK